MADYGGLNREHCGEVRTAGDSRVNAYLPRKVYNILDEGQHMITIYLPL